MKTYSKYNENKSNQEISENDINIFEKMIDMKNIKYFFDFLYEYNILNYALNNEILFEKDKVEKIFYIDASLQESLIYNLGGSTRGAIKFYNLIDKYFELDGYKFANINLDY
ncbi:hypothetical protein M0Q50_01895 [bacterium]|jgi:hypothetical protein|nr:hypothetical protein [bacterium]